ncbi:MAG: BON domain-containing protein [Burkholderiaceae bacterium]
MQANLEPVMTDTDLDLETEVRDALDQLDILKGSEAQVAVEVKDSLVTLRGNVQSPMSCVEVEWAAAAVPGVMGVTNMLVDDAELSRRVAMALAYDPRTAAIQPGYEVAPMFGHIQIIGKFSDEQAAAVAAVGEAVPEVRSLKLKRL